MARVRQTRRVSTTALRRRIEDGVYAALYAAGDLVRADMQHSIVEGSISGKGHVPSAPGQPPNADTRLLDTSIVTVGHRERMAVEVRVEAPYGLALEVGTVTMAARPFARPALQRNRPVVQTMITNALKRSAGG